MKKRNATSVISIITLLVIAIGISVEPSGRINNTSLTKLSFEIVASYPHDRSAFTEGLAYDSTALYESTGISGKSTLRRVELVSGAVLQSFPLSKELFGEGITIMKDRIIQLTWRSRQGFVYDKNSFGLLRTFEYPTEGWGITYDGVRLIMSDGSSTLYFLDPESLQINGQIDIHDFDNSPITRLNELEYVQGEIYANVWATNRIAVIDPQTGQAKAWIDLTGLSDHLENSDGADVLNGIAYDEENDRLFVTGKLWPNLFEIKLILLP